MTPKARLGAILLAAGRGERIGGPKALLEIDGKTLAERHVERAFALGCHRVVLVVRPEVAGALDTRPCPGLVLAISEAPDPAGSLAVGVRALEGCDRVLVTPVDALPVGEETCTVLLSALDRGAQAATPVHEGRGGHPVICLLEVLAPYPFPMGKKAPQGSPENGPPPLRSVLRELGAGRVRVDVDDPAVEADLDTPEDLRAFAGTSPRFAERVVFRGVRLHV